MPNRPRSKRRQRIRATFPQLCAYCGATERLTLDHIVPRVWGGTNVEANFQLLCDPCHQQKSKREIRYKDDRINRARGKRLQKKIHRKLQEAAAQAGLLNLLVLPKLVETFPISTMAKPDRKPDPDFEPNYDVADAEYDDTVQASNSEGADPDYDEGSQDANYEVSDPDAEDGGSQEWRLRPQR